MTRPRLLTPPRNFIRVSLPVLVNMGKKNRRREKREKTSLTRGPSDIKFEQADVVDKFEAAYPSWNYPLHTMPPDVWRLLVKHRFGGLSLARGNWSCVKISAAIVRDVRNDREKSIHFSFEGEEAIWDARNMMALVQRLRRGTILFRKVPARALAPSPAGLPDVSVVREAQKCQ